MNENGFIITIDSFLGITLLFVLLVMAYFFFSQVSLDAWNNIDLRNSVNDEATVLTKTFIFENAINQSSSEVISMAINTMPPNLCLEVTIMNSIDYSPLLHATKSSCVKSNKDVVAVNRNVSVRNDSRVNFYIAKVEGWYK